MRGYDPASRLLTRERFAHPCVDQVPLRQKAFILRHCPMQEQSAPHAPGKSHNLLATFLTSWHSGTRPSRPDTYDDPHPDRDEASAGNSAAALGCVPPLDAGLVFRARVGDFSATGQPGSVTPFPPFHPNKFEAPRWRSLRLPRLGPNRVAGA